MSSLGDGASRVGVCGWNTRPTNEFQYVNGRGAELYAQYRIDTGTLYDGTPRKNELTIGFRWDFGH